MEKTGEIEVRLLEELDLPAALRFSEAASWNQTESDWRRLLELEPRGCFCATLDGQVVGTTTSTTYGRELAWIGMVLADPAHRRRGIGTDLMRAALDYLHEAGVSTVKLDATPAGRPLYERLDFKIESLIERWSGVVANTTNAACAKLDVVTRDELCAFDHLAFGVDRSRLLGLLIEDAHIAPLVSLTTDRQITGYGLARRGTAADYVGPLVASSSDAATALLDGLLNQLEDRQVYIDLNTDFRGAKEILIARGLVKQRDLFRMSYGEKSNAGCSQDVFAIAGPEFG